MTRLRLLIFLYAIFFLPSCTPPPTPQPSLIPTHTHTPTLTLSPTPTDTPTPIPLYDLEGSLFFDYNGNGEWDESEPPIVGFGICAKPSGQDEVCVDTDENGFYHFEELSPANTQVFIRFNDINSDVPELTFRYLSLSLEEFRPISDSVSLTIQGDITQNWGLMHGFLTMPFSNDVTVHGMRYVDLNREEADASDWRGFGDRNQYLSWCFPTFDQHLGTDIYTDRNQPVLAAAPGFIFKTRGNWPNHPDDKFGTEDGNFVLIFHPVYSDSSGYITGYFHLDSVNVNQGQIVERGLLIGYSDRTGVFRDCDPGHTHFQLNVSKNGYFEGVNTVMCPYNEGLWTKYNDPQFP